MDKFVLCLTRRRVAYLRRYALSASRRIVLAFLSGIAAFAVGAGAQTVTAPLEDRGSISVAPIPGSVPTPPRVACERFYGRGWKRVSASSPVVVQAAPFLMNDVDRRAVAYFTNSQGHLLVCTDGGYQGCGDRHITYKAVGGKWLRDSFETVIVC